MTHSYIILKWYYALLAELFYTKNMGLTMEAARRVYVSVSYATVGSDNSLSPVQRQSIT